MSATPCDRIAISSVAILGLCLGGARPPNPRRGRRRSGRPFSEAPALERTNQAAWTCRRNCSRPTTTTCWRIRTAGSDRPRSAQPMDSTPGCRSAFSTPTSGGRLTLDSDHQHSVNYYPGSGRPDDHLPSGRRTRSPSRFGRRYTIYAARSLPIRRIIRCGSFSAPLPVDPGRRLAGWPAPGSA